MKSSKDSNVRHKVTIVIALYTMIAMITVGVAFIATDLLGFRDAFQNDLISLAKALEGKIPPIIAEQDQRAGKKPVSEVQSKPGSVQFSSNIMSALILGSNGKVIYKYGRDGEDRSSHPAATLDVKHTALERVQSILSADENHFRYHAGFVDLEKYVFPDGKETDIIFIRSDLQPFYAHLKRYLPASAIAALMIVLCASLASRRLRTLVSPSLFELTRKIEKVTADSDSAIPFYSDANDESWGLSKWASQTLTHVQKLEEEKQKHSSQIQSLHEEQENQVAAQALKLAKSKEAVKKCVSELNKIKEDTAKANLKGAQRVSTMAQQIRSPTDEVMHMIGAILDTDLDQKQRELAESAKRSGEALLEILRRTGPPKVDSDRTTTNATGGALDGELEQESLITADSKAKFSGKVLVAEEDAADQGIVKSYLERFGCEVELAKDGSEAVEAWSRNPYDLIFIGCQMTNMDGYGAAKFIRQMERLDNPNQKRGIPIVALSSGNQEGVRELCMDAGMDDFLCKPFKSKDFQKVLECWLLKKPA